MNDHVYPCLWFDNQAEQAAAFYIDTFGGSVLTRTLYPQSLDNGAGKPFGSVMGVEFEIDGRRFTAVNGGPMFTINPSISFYACVKQPDAAKRLFATLATDGQTLVPFDDYGDNPILRLNDIGHDLFGWAVDRFGVSWQVMTTAEGEPDVHMAPCLTFCGPQASRAEEAIAFYTALFPDSKVQSLVRYRDDDQAPTGTLKRGLFSIAGQPVVAIDSHLDHAFNFNEAVSLQVLCDDQSELDAYWDALLQDGTPQMCGWLKDRFGVIWQVVPRRSIDWMSSEDHAARDRVFVAIRTMVKLDIAALQRAFDG